MLALPRYKNLSICNLLPNIKLNQKFCNILARTSLQRVYHVTEMFKQWKVPAMGGSIVEVGALTPGVLLHSRRDLKTAQMNVQRCLIRELKLCEFEMDQPPPDDFT